MENTKSPHQTLTIVVPRKLADAMKAEAKRRRWQVPAIWIQSAELLLEMPAVEPFGPDWVTAKREENERGRRRT
jgi:hypothetical protein